LILEITGLRSSIEHWGITVMSDISELKEHAARLTRQIGLIRTEFGIDEINKKVGAIELEIRELRHDKHRLTRENEELMGSLKSLISSVENTRLSELPDSFQSVGKKLDALLEIGRTRDAPAAARTTARSSVAADIVVKPKEGRAEAAMAKELDKPDIPSGLRQGPDKFGARRPRARRPR
jgi:chromosome segregation ATPase